MISLDYPSFLKSKSQIGKASGFEPKWMPDFLYDFQTFLTAWAVQQGRAAIYADTGLGKTAMELVWAENVFRKTRKPVLIVTPLAVAAQIAREALKFGIDCRHDRTDKVHQITVTNYERLAHFNPDDFAGVVGDEISAIKAFDGKRRKTVTRFLSKMRYRLLASATPAPNDFIELGTAAEALGVMTQSEMLSTFFVASDNARHNLFREGDYWNRDKWFFRPHAAVPFWRWVCSWARACRKPSDCDPSFDDAPFSLPPLNITQHVTESVFIPSGQLFPVVARTLKEQREERRRTINERCEKVAALIKHNRSAVAWCQYNAEGDLLEKLIPDSVQVAGCDTDEDKESRLEAFAKGDVRVLVTNPRVAAWGLNWQHCAHQTFFPSHSFEQWYQAVRRSWRFGQTKPVQIDVVSTKGEAGVTENLQKKQAKANEMFTALVQYMRRGETANIQDRHQKQVELPAWI